MSGYNSDKKIEVSRSIFISKKSLHWLTTFTRGPVHISTKKRSDEDIEFIIKENIKP